LGSVPPRWALRIKRYLARSGQQDTEHIPGFNPSKGRSNAVVDAPAERNMSAWNLPSQVDGLGTIKHRGISVGGTPEQQDCCSSGDLHTTEFSVIWRESHVIPERWLQPQRFLHELRDHFGILTQLILKVSVLGEDTNGIAEQARGGFTTGAEQCVENDVGLHFGERLTVDALGDSSEKVMRWLAHGG
jgi:hypothetical protein